MKSIFGFVVFIFLFFLITLVFYLYSNSGGGKSLVSSPIPDVFKNFNIGSTTEIFFNPNKRVIRSKIKKPDIQALSAISYDLETNNLIFSKNIDKKLPIASLTKVMTALVALEEKNEDDLLTVSEDASRIGENSMGLSAGEKLTVKELLYGLFLHSGNDAAETLAQGSALGRENFIYRMNKKAEDLGLSDTHFTNPSGLEGDGNQYSTVFDLLVISKHALDKKVILEVARTPYIFIPYTDTHKAFELYNETNLLTTYKGVRGLKTGYTEEAGLCLITYLEYKNHKIIAIVLNSPSRREEMIQILDFSLKSLGVSPPKHG